ncbi:rab family small GTPase [Reticulomyxa filosa]|uniref:Rab family small GTPase n=1 Tax=Reticulomyxa filosa TaxID=46433 RepID=X6MX14_RETFI|nr:rab family small GTPase [Reticulomyxa filosa]|eukprot:ETO18012.1 rab family small GTPase [Reticulomyxa filosa]
MTESSDEETGKVRQYKIILLGDGAVGKTSICEQFVNEHFATSYKQTIGCEFYVKRIQLQSSTNESLPVDAITQFFSFFLKEIKNICNTEPTLFFWAKIALQVWDIGGQSIGSKMLSKYIHGSDGILLIYDVTAFMTFENIQDWLTIVKTTLGNHGKAKIGLVGNKHDMSNDSTVKLSKQEDLCSREKLLSYHVSAKTNDGIDSLFYHFTAQIAGVSISKQEIQKRTKVVKAQVIHHEPTKLLQPKNIKSSEDKKECLIL